AGTSLVPGVADASAVQLEGLRQLSNAMILNVDTYATANGVTPLPRANVALVWSFKTQTIGKTLAAIQVASKNPLDPYAAKLADFKVTASLPAANFAAVAKLPTAAYANIATVVQGTVAMPYYLDVYSTANPLGPLTGRFQVDAYGMPTVKTIQTIPFFMTIPNAPKLGGGGSWPVVIFQHGFTVDKNAMFGIANTLAKAGFATIAIDSVLHGSRTFKLDLVTESKDSYGNVSVTANVADGYADSSGRHYLNLSYLLTTRDNARQSVADLIHLTRLLEVQTMDVVNNITGLAPGGDGADLDTAANSISFVGHSNGGILGTMFASVDPYVKTIVLANAGAGYGDIFQNSIEVSPLINAGLEAKGITVGSADYLAFMNAAQTVGDDSDPINYGITYNNWIATNAKKVFVLKTTPDKVVPNSATNTLISILGPLTQVGIAAANSPLLGSSGYVNYISGTHSTFLRPAGVTNPTEFLAAYTQMQKATVNFLAGSGVTVIAGSTVVE
ncbi:MAG: hypothetical protein Q9M20_06025, partial [Mariprofundaceae bacterium]|nr:hypothetical protein [Mariprofundaceae bacterium]